MVESTIDKIKDITVERQIRKLAGVIDEQNDVISKYQDASTDIDNLKDSDVNQNTQINNIKSDIAKNNTATEVLNNRVTSVEQEITKTDSEIESVKSAITNIQSKDVAQDGTLSTHSSQIQGITESLVSDVEILNGITTGEIKVRIDREAASAIDSNSYNLGLPVSAEIIQGTGPSMFKVQITMSSGVKVVSNDFVFTTEAIGTDVYISSFTFKAGNQDGYLSADIGLNNGVIIEANNFLVPTDPNVISNITDLQTRMSEVEGFTADIESINTEISGIMSDLSTKADVNNLDQTIVTGGVTTSSLIASSIVSPSLNAKADLANTSQIISALGYIGESVYVKANGEKTYPVLNNNAVTDSTKPLKVLTQMDTAEYGTIGLDTGYVALIDANGAPKNFSAGNDSGEVWEEIDPANLPTDWIDGDRIKICVDCSLNISAVGTWTSSLPSTLEIITGEKHPQVIELSINDSGISGKIPIFGYAESYGIYECNLYANGTPNSWNTGEYPLLIFRVSFLNGSGCKAVQRNVAKSELSSFVYKMWRLKK